MKVHEQRDKLIDAIELALPYLGDGPTLQAFGIAREDCALAHMDYFGAVDAAKMVLVDALASIRGTTPAEMFEALGLRTRPCDCRSCAGEEASAKARERHRAAYTKVKEWAE